MSPGSSASRSGRTAPPKTTCLCTAPTRHAPLRDENVQILSLRSKNVRYLLVPSGWLACVTLTLSVVDPRSVLTSSRGDGRIHTRLFRLRRVGNSIRLGGLNTEFSLRILTTTRFPEFSNSDLPDATRGKSEHGDSEHPGSRIPFGSTRVGPAGKIDGNQGLMEKFADHSYQVVPGTSTQ